MQAIEFETHLENGFIQPPASYQHWQEGKQVKVIVLVDETVDDQGKQQTRQSINHHAGNQPDQDPLDFQNNIRDEWA